MERYPVDESGFCHKLLMLGRRHAMWRGLHGEDAEDCAVEFTLHVLTHLHSAQAGGKTTDPVPFLNADWLHRRAHMHTRNFQRTVFTHADRFGSLPIPEPASVEGHTGNVMASLLRAEFWEHIFAALASLDSVPRRLLIGRQLHQQSIGTLAGACGRSEHAVEQALMRARRQMRRVLERRGCSEAVLREYVAAFATNERSPAACRKV